MFLQLIFSEYGINIAVTSKKVITGIHHFFVSRITQNYTVFSKFSREDNNLVIWAMEETI